MNTDKNQPVIFLTGTLPQETSLKTFKDCFETSGYADLGVENAYMLVQTIFGDILKNRDHDLIVDEAKVPFLEETCQIVLNLWRTKFPERLFRTKEQRKSIFQTLSEFFGSATFRFRRWYNEILSIRFEAKFLNDFQSLNFNDFPVWQYEVYLNLMPVFIKMRHRVVMFYKNKEMMEMIEPDSLYKKFGVTDREEHSAERSSINVNPKIPWDFSQENTAQNLDDRLFFNLSGTNCLSISHQRERRSIQSILNSSSQQDFYYEVKLIHLQQSHKVFGIGCAPDDFDCHKNQMVGWYQGSCGYHSDDGKIYNNTGSSSLQSKRGDYDNDDIVGCGLSTMYKVIYFTRNGAIEAIVPNYNKDKCYHPTMTFVRVESSFYDRRIYGAVPEKDPTVIKIVKEEEFMFKSGA